MDRKDMLEQMKPGSVVMEDGTKLKYRPIAGFVCIYCGGFAKIVDFASDQEFDGEPEFNGGQGVLHTTPECSSFVAMDPLTYVRENRKKFQQDIADGKVAPN